MRVVILRENIYLFNTIEDMPLSCSYNAIQTLKPTKIKEMGYSYPDIVLAGFGKNCNILLYVSTLKLIYNLINILE